MTPSALEACCQLAVHLWYLHGLLLQPTVAELVVRLPCTRINRYLNPVHDQWAQHSKGRQSARCVCPCRNQRVMLSYCPADGRRWWRRPFACPAQLDRLALCLRQDARPRDILQGILQVSGYYSSV